MGCARNAHIEIYRCSRRARLHLLALCVDYRTSVHKASPGFVHFVFSNLLPAFDLSRVSGGRYSVDSFTCLGGLDTLSAIMWNKFWPLSFLAPRHPSCVGTGIKGNMTRVNKQSRRLGEINDALAKQMFSSKRHRSTTGTPDITQCMFLFSINSSKYRAFGLGSKAQMVLKGR